MGSHEVRFGYVVELKGKKCHGCNHLCSMTLFVSIVPRQIISIIYIA